MAGGTDRGLSTYGFGVQKHDGKGVFTNLEGGLESAHCPACGKDVERYFYDMVSDWYEADGFPAEVVDTVGAGDSHVGAFLSARLEGLDIAQALDRKSVV